MVREAAVKQLKQLKKSELKCKTEIPKIAATAAASAPIQTKAGQIRRKDFRTIRIPPRNHPQNPNAVAH